MQLNKKFGGETLAHRFGEVKMGVVALAAALALTAAVGMATPAMAQDVAEADAVTLADRTLGIRDEVRQAGLEAAAETLGMTPDDLEDALWGGKTLAELAEAENVPLSEVRAAVEEATSTIRQTRVREFIVTQVEKGRITQARADWIFEGMDNGWFELGRFGNVFDGLGRDLVGRRR